MDLSMENLLIAFKDQIQYIGNQHMVTNKFKQIHKKSFLQDNLFIAEGIWLHEKLLTKPMQIESFIFCPECIHSTPALSLLKAWLERCATSYAVSKKVMNSLSERDNVDGFMSLGIFPKTLLSDLLLKKDSVVLILDGLESPGNIGMILRTCDGAGVDAVFLCHSKIKITHSKLIKSSMGAVLDLPIVEFASIETCNNWLKTHQFKVYLADTQAKDTYQKPDYYENTALVMGNERYGISKEWYDKEPHLISIPMLGGCDSLNVGVAASIILYEICLKRNIHLGG